MPKMTISKLARMSQREFLEIRQTVTEELREMRAELAALRSEVATVGMNVDQRLLTVTDGLHLVLGYADELAARRRPRPARRQRSRPLRARRGL